MEIVKMEYFPSFPFNFENNYIRQLGYMCYLKSGVLNVSASIANRTI